MITLFTILGTRYYLLDYPNLHDTYNELKINGTILPDVKEYNDFHYRLT